MITPLERAVLTYYATSPEGARRAKDLAKEFRTGLHDEDRSGRPGSVFEGFTLAQVKEVREAYVVLGCIFRRGQTSSAVYWTLEKGKKKLEQPKDE